MASLTRDLKHVLAVALRRPDSDADLLGRFAATRDEAAFAEIVRRHGPAVLRVCRSLLSRADADDAFQATFFVLARRAESLGDVKSLGGWLIGVAGRVARQLRKAGWRRAAVEKQIRPHDSADEKTDQNMKELSEELTQLPACLRDPVVLCYLEAKTQDEAAAELGQSVRTLRRRMEKAKHVLRLRLERRGVAPSVLAVSAPLWIPSDAAARTAACAVQFLAGGVRTPAATLAKGIAMAALKWKVAASLVVTAGLFIAIGSGVAQDVPKPGANPPKTDKRTESKTAVIDDGIFERDGTKKFAIRFKGVKGTWLVLAANPTIARVIHSEINHNIEALSKLWFGESAGFPEVKAVIDVSLTGTSGSVTQLHHNPANPLEVEMKLCGPLDVILVDELPREVAHVVLGAHFGANLPRWVDDGLALTATSPEHQAVANRAIRQFLNAGKGYLLKVLFGMKEYPAEKADSGTLVTEATSVVRFLLWSTPTRGVPVLSDSPYINRLFKNPVDPPKELIRFVEIGMKDGWDSAGKEVYGFESVGQLEEAWIKWLMTPASREGLPAVTPTQPPPVAPDPGRIPPVNLGK